MEKLIELMKVYFATNFQYYVKSHGYHVNVVGADFYQYHKLFQKVYEDAQTNIDAIAEEIRTLQGTAPFSLKRIMELSELGDAEDTPPGLEMVKELLDDTEVVCETIRAARLVSIEENAFGLVNYLEGRLDDHYKLQWMLRSTIEK
jgi:starvation-inducible DNA-binding protein